MWQVTSGDRFQSGGLKCRPDERVRRRDQPRGPRDFAHLGGHVTGHHALHRYVGAVLAAAAVFGVKFATKFLDEFLRHAIIKQPKTESYTIVIIIYYYDNKKSHQTETHQQFNNDN